FDSSPLPARRPITSECERQNRLSRTVFTQMTLDELLHQPVYGLSQEVKEQVLLEHLNELTSRHREHCAPYRRLLNYLHPSSDPATLCSEVPYVPVGLFKSYELLSIPREDVQMV